MVVSRRHLNLRHGARVTGSWPGTMGSKLTNGNVSAWALWFDKSKSRYSPALICHNR